MRLISSIIGFVLTTTLWATCMSNEISLIPALRDNYIYLIQHGTHALVVDPAEAEPLLKILRQKDLTLTYILNTHHHRDHVGGNGKIKTATHCSVIGPDDKRIPSLDLPVHEGEDFTFETLTFQVISVPGHTTTHIAFFVPEKKWLFSGDVLFTGGCGRVFEGTPQQMLDSLGKLAQLPKETLIFCGHEYTLKNMQFAAKIEPDNSEVHQRLSEVKALRQKGKATVGSTLEVELKTNPFLRVGDPVLRKALNMEKATDIEVFTTLRAMKDRF